MFRIPEGFCQRVVLSVELDLPLLSIPHCVNKGLGGFNYFAPVNTLPCLRVQRSPMPVPPAFGPWVPSLRTWTDSSRPQLVLHLLPPRLPKAIPSWPHNMIVLLLSRIFLIFFRYLNELLRFLLLHKFWPIMFQFLILSFEIRSLVLLDKVMG